MKKTIFILMMSFGALLVQEGVKGQSQVKKNALPIAQIAKDTTKLTLNVEGMHCQAGCANSIDNMLKQQKGIVKSETTYASGTSFIWFNKKAISEKKIISLIEDRGFKAAIKKED